MTRFGSMRLAACAATAMVLVACSDSSSGGSAAPANVVTGSMVGRTLNAQDAVSYTSATSTLVTIGDYASICSYGTALKSNSNTLTFEFGTTMLAAGKIAFGADPSLKVTYTFYDAACNGGVTETTSAGTGAVTLTKADSNSVAGTFDLTINGDHITGQFNAPSCAALNNSAGASTATADGGTSGGTSGEGGTTGSTTDAGGTTSATGQICK
jgi:hypothetical protein